ncbi:MAG: hypothetical protein Q8T11_08120 [Elusimicrobiota bacterium]|nr:hypothetical protein [Elusimicrobiota bacterium]
MRAGLLLAAAVLSACRAEPSRPFPVGLLRPVPPRVAAEAARLGFDVAAAVPDGAVSAYAGAPSHRVGTEVAADWTALRLLSARAVADGARGFYFRLPPAPAGRDHLDYPEELQAPARVLRELQALRPVLEFGADASAPFAAPPGVRARAWHFRGRGYLLLVNDSGDDAAFEGEVFEGLRALFEARSDARRVLTTCGGRFCLPAGRALWLEGRLR